MERVPETGRAWPQRAGYLDCIGQGVWEFAKGPYASIQYLYQKGLLFVQSLKPCLVLSSRYGLRHVSSS